MLTIKSLHGYVKTRSLWFHSQLLTWSWGCDFAYVCLLERRCRVTSFCVLFSPLSTGSGAVAIHTLNTDTEFLWEKPMFKSYPFLVWARLRNLFNKKAVSQAEYGGTYLQCQHLGAETGNKDIFFSCIVGSRSSLGSMRPCLKQTKVFHVFLMVAFHK